MSKERREQQRFSIRTNATVTLRHTTEEAEVIPSVAANISSGGAFLTTSHPFALAAKVKVEFYLGIADLKRLMFILSEESLRQIEGERFWVSANAIVIRREKDGVAVIFDTDYQFTPMQSRGARE